MDQRAFTREIRRIEFALRTVWPFMRPFLSRHLSRRCRRCVLSEAHGPLDAQGLCRLCAQAPVLPAGSGEPAVPVHEGPNPADQLFAETAGRGAGAYDALLLLSGGKDSAFLLHRLRRDHPRLRLLAVLVDNGFMSPFALENVERVRRHFDLELFALCPPPGFVRSVFRWGLTHLDRQKGYSLTDILDGQMTFDAALNLAASMAVPLVIAGVSRVQIEQVFGSGVWVCEGNGMDLATPGGASREEVFPDPEGRLWYRAERWPLERRPRFVMPFVCWDPTERHILAEVERLGLLARGRTSPLATNNRVIPLIGLVEVARFGYSSFEVEFSRMIREGKSERGWWLNLFEALEYAARTGRLLGGTALETLKALELSPAEVGIGRGG